MAIRQNGKYAKWQVGKMARRQNGKQAKWQVGKVLSRPIDAAPSREAKILQEWKNS